MTLKLAKKLWGVWGFRKALDVKCQTICLWHDVS